MKAFARHFDRFDELKTEMEEGRKKGFDYREDRGKTGSIINLYHPKTIDFEISEIMEETPDVKTFRLTPANGYVPPFLAGQYINVFGEVKGIRTSRPYSISSSPLQRKYYDITVARVADGFFSDYMLNIVKKGDHLQTSGPSGHFYFNPLFHSRHSVFIAGGCGITPFMSMIREICESGLDRKVTLLYGNRAEKNIIFHEELKELASRNSNFNYVPVISDPSEGFSGQCGFIDACCVQKFVPDLSECTYYICGPEAMYEYCLPQLESMNLPGRKIRREMFPSAKDITKEKGWPQGLTGKEEFSVTVSGGRTIKAKSGETLLVALERAGIIIPVNCRCGECSICRVKLVSGKVYQPRNVHLRLADAKFGYIHSCKCYPLEDLEIMI